MRYIIAIMICSLLAACSTYSNDSFTIVGNPSMRVNYSAHIYNEFPVEFKLSGAKKQHLVIRLQGYAPLRLNIENDARGWWFGSVYFKKLPPSLFVSSDNGEIYAYNATMTKHLLQRHSVESTLKDGYLIISVMAGDMPVGTKVDQLVTK